MQTLFRQSQTTYLHKAQSRQRLSACHLSQQLPIPSSMGNSRSEVPIPASSRAISLTRRIITPSHHSELVMANLHSRPITSTSPASAYWGIDQSVAYGSDTVLPLTAGIVDTGTTLLLLATDAYDAYTAATGATPDSSTGLLSITPEQFAALESLFFTIGGVGPIHLTHCRQHN